MKVWEGITGKYKPEDESTSPTEGRACAKFEGLYFLAMHDETVSIWFITRTLTFQLKVGKADYDKVSDSGLWSPDILIEPYRKKKRRNSRSKPRVPKQNGELPENRRNGMKSHIAINDRSVWLRKPSMSS